MDGCRICADRPAQGRPDVPPVQPEGREVIISAQQEARALHHNYIGTEHVLLGLLRDREGVAGRALHVLGISPETCGADPGHHRRGQAERPGTSRSPRGPRSPGAGRPRGRPPRPSLRGHRAHPARPGAGRDGVGWHVLSRLGVTVPKLRDQVLELVSQDQRTPSEVIARRYPDYDAGSSWPARQGRRRGRKDLDRARPRARARRSWWPTGTPDRALVVRVDVATLGRELDWLRDEVNRLQRLRLENGHRARCPSQFPGRATRSGGSRGPRPAVRLTSPDHRKRRSLCPAVRRRLPAASARPTPANCRARCSWARQSPPVARCAMAPRPR